MVKLGRRVKRKGCVVCKRVVDGGMLSAYLPQESCEEVYKALNCDQFTRKIFDLQDK